MQFSPQQEVALKEIKNWYANSSRQPFVLNGYAGTGKTTIAKYMPEIIGAQSQEEIIYVAYTGKAALQLQKKGCVGATTAHKLLYMPLGKNKQRLRELTKLYEEALMTDPHERKDITKDLKRSMKEQRKLVDGVEFINAPDEERVKQAKIIIVDESSMVDQQIHEDLLALDLPIIYCGDPFQLPPVKGNSPVSMLPVDVMLTEVHRQALENPILRMATDIRNNENVYLDECHQGIDDEGLHIVKLRNSNYEMYNSHDQIICAKNRTRGELNRKMRARKILDGLVKEEKDFPLGVSDRVIFLRNDYDRDFFNGTLANIGGVEGANDYGEYSLEISGKTDDDEFESYPVWAGLLFGRHKAESPEFGQFIDLAYAITCHKSQGSEWDSVLVHWEWLYGQDSRRWTYTALTRARKKCTIVVPSNLRNGYRV